MTCPHPPWSRHSCHLNGDRLPQRGKGGIHVPSHLWARQKPFSNSGFMCVVQQTSCLLISNTHLHLSIAVIFVI